jgi:transcriptional regulator with XRE-family HTH domain
MTLPPDQLKSARELLGWSKSQLAIKSGLTAETVALFETGKRRPTAPAVSTMRQILESVGVEFTNDGQPGVRMKAATNNHGLAISDEAALPEIPETAGRPCDGAPV